MSAPLLITEELKQALRETSVEAEAQRLALLRGRRFLIVMGGYTGKRSMYEHARALGVNSCFGWPGSLDARGCARGLVRAIHRG